MKQCRWWRKVLESSGPLPSRLLSSSTEYHNRTWHKPTWPPNDSHCCILILLPVSLSTWGYKQQHNNILTHLDFSKLTISNFLYLVIVSHLLTTTNFQISHILLSFIHFWKYQYQFTEWSIHKHTSRFIFIAALYKFRIKYVFICQKGFLLIQFPFADDRTVARRGWMTFSRQEPSQGCPSGSVDPATFFASMPWLKRSPLGASVEMNEMKSLENT